MSAGVAPPGALTPDPTEAARAALLALEGPDHPALAGWVHPERGLLLSPYATVLTGEGVILLPHTVEALADDDPVRHWGWYDGSGDPIELTFREYHDRFVWNRDYATAPEVSVDRRIGTSTSVDNLAEAFPGATVVEFHHPGTDPELHGMDWGSLRLVMERDGERWWLIAVVGDRWTT